jgi:hypothetical protein
MTMHHRRRRLLPCQRARPDAGTDLLRAEAAGRIVVHGADPRTCQVELVRPAVPTYDPAPRLPIEAWLAGWRAAHMVASERDLAVVQDLTRFRAGILLLMWLEPLDDREWRDAIVTRVRFDEAAVVAHQWFLLERHGSACGMHTFATLHGQVRRADVETEAGLALMGLATLRAPGNDDGPESEVVL